MTKQMSGVHYMSIKEFRELGLLQELNRQFLHPLGLAMEVVVTDRGDEYIGGIWDYRDDPEGLIYGPDTMSLEKVQRVAELYNEKLATRMEKLGYMIQPPPTVGE